MNRQPDAAADAGRPSPRLLVVETRRKAGSPGLLAAALGEAGYAVDAVARPADLEAALKRGGYDVIVLDLSAPALGDQIMAASGPTLKKMSAVREPSRPAMLVIRPPRPRGERALRLPADVTLAKRDASQVVREVAEIVAARRLCRIMDDNERLRDTVQFARDTAHDLAQPLTTILARAQLLRRALKPDDPHARAVGIICEEAERLARMMEEFQKLKVMSRPQEQREE